MPELPEVEVIARGLAASLVGRAIRSAEAVWPSSLLGGEAAFARTVEGRAVEGVARRGKLLLLALTGGRTLAVHLRMTGRLVHQPLPEDGPHDRVRLELADGSRLVFSDVRRFGTMGAFLPGTLELWDFYRNLGPEPLEMSTADFVDRLKGRRTRIKALLLDQHVVAGVGNIYADESLFRAGIRPSARGCDVSRARLAALHACLKDVLLQAIAENGSSIRDYRDSGGNAGAFQNAFRVYGRHGQPCVHCGSILLKSTVAGRTTSHCPKCQR
ncbi:MAG: bifunctional DNA-formamidopyrimidine glycosylase/DNA-(apurinic or apyrimidinic site) lyase [Desulfovibrionaceae bacterium]